MVKDSLIVGHSKLRQYNTKNHPGVTTCTVAGIQLPASSRLTVSNVTFVNFNESGCATLRACAHCAHFKKRGGWTTRFEKMRYINSPKLGT